MDSNRFTDLIRGRRDELLVPWTVMTSAIGLIAIVSSIITNDKFPAELSRFVVPLFWVLALADVALSVLLPMRLLSTKQIAEHMASTPQPRELSKRLRTNEVDPELTTAISELTPTEQRLYGLMQLSWKPMLLGLALSVGVALVGCVLSIVARNFLVGFPMMVMALGLNALHFPRPQRLLERGRTLAKDEEMAELDKDLRQMELDMKIKTSRRRPTRPTPGP